MPHPESESPERRKLHPEEVYQLAKETLERHEKIVCANDVDLTVSDGGTYGQDDPRETLFHPTSGNALAMIEASGHSIGFISNRGGKDVARMATASGMHHPTIVGTFGFETFQTDADHPSLGEAIIDERFEPYNDPITFILKHMHAVALDFSGHYPAPGFARRKLHEEPFNTGEIPTKHGPIILEAKGRCHTFPYGLAEGFVLNKVDPTARAQLVTAMKSEYHEALKTAMQKYTLATMVVHKIWGMEHDSHEPEESGRYSISFVPKVRQGKAYGMVRLLRGIRQTLPADDRIGLVLFGGDSNADAEAMRSAAMAAKIHNRDVFESPVHSVGIWVKPEQDQPTVHKQADLIVNGPTEYAIFLKELANVIQRYS